MGVEQIRGDRVPDRHVRRRHLDQLEAGQALLAECDDLVPVREGKLMREQDILVGDGDDVVVERTCRDRRFRLLDEQSPVRIEPVQSRNRLRRLQMLAGGKGAARHSVDEQLKPRLAMLRGEPHMVGCALIAERRRDGVVDRELALIRESRS